MGNRATLLGSLLGAASVAAALADVGGDAADADPDHDIVDLAVDETAAEVRFTATVAGVLRAPSPGLDEVRWAFRVVPDALYLEGEAPQPLGTAFTIQANTAGAYGVFRDGGFGYTLPEQPASGEASATWRVPKAYLDALGLRRPMAGDWLSGVRAETRALSVAADVAGHPDLALAQDQPPGIALHLRGALLGPRTLAAAGPAADDHVPALAAMFDGVLVGAWVGPRQAHDLPLRDVAAFLWLSASSTTPVLADEDLAVELYAQDALGRRTLVAQRAEALSGVPGASTNLFLVPGVPQRLPLQLMPVAGATVVPAGSAVVLQVKVGGFVAEESGPIAVHYDSAEADSFVTFGQAPLPAAATCPAAAHAQTAKGLPAAACKHAA